MIESILQQRSVRARTRITVKTVLAAGLVALAVLLPQLVHVALGAPGGVRWLPMYLPVLLAGCLLGPAWGLGVGVLSSLCNYLLNYFLVFHSHTAHGKSASLYTVITVVKTMASALLVAFLAGLLPAGVPELAVKIPVDVALFFVNYLAQKAFVY